MIDRPHRLQGRQPDVGAQGVRRDRRRAVRPGVAGRSRTGGRDRRARRRPLRRHGRARSRLGRRRFARASRRDGPCSASVSGCSGCSPAARKRPTAPALVCCRARCYSASRHWRTAELPRGWAPRDQVPHVGWNSLAIERPAPIVAGVATGSQVYFTHSFVAPVTGDTVAVTEHGEPFAAIVQRGHIAGVQFHPEKSGDVGLQILRNFRRRP